MDHRRAGHGANAHGWLRSMQFMLRVTVEDVSDRYAVLGEPIRARVRPRGAAGLGRPVAGGGPGACARPRAGTVCGLWPDRRTFGRRPCLARVSSSRAVSWPPRSGTEPLAGTWAAEALRIHAWEPRLGFETDHRTIAHEVDWLLPAVHLHMGCYRGQETIARVHNQDDRHVGSSCCTSTVRGTRCWRPGPRSWPVTGRWGA